MPFHFPDRTFWNRRETRELILIALAAGGIFLFVWMTGVSTALLRALGFSPILDATVILFVLLTVGLMIFALRRWRDADRAQAEYRDMFDQAPLGYYQYTPDGHLLRVNKAFAELIGYDSPTELLAWQDVSSSLYVNPERRIEFTQALDREGVIRNFEHQVYRKDGSIIWVLGDARAVRDARGNVLYYEGSARDVTARKETEEVYRRLVDESLQGIVIFQDGHIVLSNQAAADLFHIGVGRLVTLAPTRIAELIHPADRALVLERLQARLEGKNVPSRLVFQILRPSGETRWLEMAANRIIYRGEPAVLVALADVTERMQAHDAMERSVQRARMLEELTASLARAGNDLDAVLNTAARLLASMIGDLCVVFLSIPDGSVLEPVAFAHKNPTRQQALRAALRDLRLDPDHPYLRELLRGEMPRLEQLDELALTNANARRALEYARQLELVSYQVVPLRQGGRVLGIVGVARESGGEPYTIQDQTLLREFADRATLSIGNAQLVRQLQRELEARRQAEAKYRTLVEQIPAITYIESAERPGETLYVSPQVLPTLGFTPEEWTGQPDFWESRLHPDDRARIVEQARRARDAELPFRAEYRILDRDGTTHWIRDEAALVFDEKHRALFEHGVMVDITAQKALEIQFTQAMTQANAERERLHAELAFVRVAERAELAQRVNDELIPPLARLQQVLEKAKAHSPEEMQDQLEANALARDLADRTRHLALAARAPRMPDIGLVPALQAFLERYATETGIRANLEVDGVSGHYAPQVEEAVFCFIQDALAKLARRAGGARTEICLAESQDALIVQVRDESRPAEVPALANGHLHEIKSLREQLARAGGELEVEMLPDQGTRLRAVLPRVPERST